ncbi:MAG: hypothetical protein KDB37_04835, partial [Ilumatobacter sp.]|nr:hypothetical protein [Ilumatobacter sp.]
MKSAAIIGDASLTGQCVEIAVQHGLDVVLVATADPGTGALAERHGIPTYSSSDDLAELLDRHPADALLSIAHLRLVPEAALARVGTAINFHDGPLPDYAGLNVTCWSIVNGERRHGITWHRMTAAVDAGAIVEERRFDIAERETAFSLNARCFESALESFPTVVRSLLDDDVAGRPQPERTRPAFRRIDRPVVLVDGHGSAADLDRSVRGLTLGALVVNPMGSVKLVGPEGAVVVNQTQLAGGPGPVVGMLAAEGGAVRLTTVDADVLLRTESASG